MSAITRMGVAAALSVGLLLLSPTLSTCAELAEDRGMCDARYPGVYHLDCLKANVSFIALAKLRLACVQAFQAVPAYRFCAWALVDYNTSSIVSAPRYGCDTYAVDAAKTQDCLQAYLAFQQSNCTELRELRSAWNRASPTVAAPANCTAPGPCAPGYPGPYHLSCYGPRIANTYEYPKEVVLLAKQQCARAFVHSDAAARANCSEDAFAGVVGSRPALYGCAVYFAYTFSSQVCLDLYQAQEKTNPNCTEYREAGLGNPVNRAQPSAYLQTDYTCPA